MSDLPAVGAAEAAALRLIFAGKVLQDAQTLSQANIKAGDVVVAMVSRVGHSRSILCPPELP